MSEGVELAAFRCMIALQEARRDAVDVVLAAVPQHAAALLASAVDDAWIAALDKEQGR